MSFTLPAFDYVLSGNDALPKHPAPYDGLDNSPGDFLLQFYYLCLLELTPVESLCGFSFGCPG